MPLTKYFQDIKEQVNAKLDSLVPSANTHPAKLHEAMRYSLFAGGKRLRPMLAMAACEAVGGRRETVLPFVAAIEMIHTYTLIHDDLPALDNDDLRRGSPTCHVRFGEATAILAGDALLTLAFEVMTNADLFPGVDHGTLLSTASETALAAGSTGTIGGQVVDIEMEGAAPDMAQLEYIHTHKTGKLILAATRGGAAIGGAADDQMEALGGYGRDVGLAFQVIDDILDVEGETGKLGKTTGSDLRKKKITYPAVMGVEDSRKLALKLVDRGIESIAPLGEAGSRLCDIARYIAARVF